MSTERPAGANQRAVPMLTEVLSLGPVVSATDVVLVTSSGPAGAPAPDAVLPVLLVRAEEPANAALADDAGRDGAALAVDAVIGAGYSTSSSAAESAMLGTTTVAAAVLPSPSGDSDAVQGALLTERVLGDVQRRIDLMLEYRLRETLTPALARMTDNFIRDTRNEIAALLREVIARSVAAEMDRERAARRHD